MLEEESQMSSSGMLFTSFEAGYLIGVELTNQAINAQAASYLCFLKHGLISVHYCAAFLCGF